MATKGFKSRSPYSLELGNADAFKSDTSFFRKSQRAGEGSDNGRPKFPDYAGGKSGKTNVDPDLKYSGGNSGHQGGNEKMG